MLFSTNADGHYYMAIISIKKGPWTFILLSIYHFLEVKKSLMGMIYLQCQISWKWKAPHFYCSTVYVIV